MRRFVPGIALAAVLALGATRAQAQISTNVQDPGLLSDPFNSYYAWYLPFQMQQATTPRPEDTIRAYSAARQQTALTERAGLYDPVGGIGAGYDPMAAFGVAGGRMRRVSTSHTGIVNLNINGSGPSGYYNRVTNYYPAHRLGRGPAARSPIGRGLRGSRGGVGGFSANPTTGMMSMNANPG